MPTKQYLWNDITDTVVMEKDGAGNTTAVYASDPVPFGRLRSMRRGGTTYNYHYDGRANTTCLTDQTGKKTDTYTYDAFGNQRTATGSTENPYRYGGQHGYQYNPATGDYYVRARVYQPKRCRWRSKDPLRFAAGINPCVYAGNGPIITFDPSGFVGVFFGGTGQDTDDKDGIMTALYDKYTGAGALVPLAKIKSDDLDQAKWAHKWVCNKVCTTCKWNCSARTKKCSDPGIDIFGYSRGAVAGIVLANLLCTKGCTCITKCRCFNLEGVIKPVPVRFLGLGDPNAYLSQTDANDVKYKSIECCVKHLRVFMAGRPSRIGALNRTFVPKKCAKTASEPPKSFPRTHEQLQWKHIYDEQYKYLLKSAKAKGAPFK